MTIKEAIETLEANYPDTCFEQLRDAVDVAISALKQTERKTGHWHKRYYSQSFGKPIEMYVCSECQHEYSYDAETGESEYNFCPNCGADARGDRDDIPSAMPEMQESI